MRSSLRLLLIVMSVLTLMAVAVPSSATHATRQSEDIEALGHSPHPASFTDPAVTRHVNSDLAFRGNLAFNGNYNGWRTIDISNPNNPVELDWYDECNGDQGDLVVWENILVRSWNSPAPDPAGAEGRTCGGDPVPEGFEGLHVFDITNLTSPSLVASVELACGSHTVTVAGVEGGNLILYSNISSSVNCVVPVGDPPDPDADNPEGDFMDVVAVPLANPAGANLVRREPLQGPNGSIRTGCHDVGVILLDVNKAACAHADVINVWDIGANATPGGSLTDPELLFTITEPGVGAATSSDPACPNCTGRWHSATWTWDGEVILAGWEPGGGGQAECEAGDPNVDKSMFFYSATNGAKLGQWVLPRPQGADENCTIHNFNVVPLTSGRYIAAGGHYQAGTWVVDFTNPASPETVAWSDPPSLGPGPFCDPDGSGGPLPPTCQLGGAWSTYWYNDFAYESEIQAGLNVFRVLDARLAPELAIDLPFLNPQTQMEPTAGFLAAAIAAGPKCKGRNVTHLGTNGNDQILGTDQPDVVRSLGGNDVVKTRDANDVVCAGPGKDRVRAGNSEKGGADMVFGQGGRDKLFGQGGRDVLRGGAKKDLIKAGSGKDKLFGQGGNDELRGQGGADALNGGGGRDRCNGGAGVDSATKCEKVQLVP